MGAKVSENFTDAHRQTERMPLKALTQHGSSKLAPNLLPERKEAGMNLGNVGLESPATIKTKLLIF